MINKDLEIRALTQELDEANAAIRAYEKVLREAVSDNYVIQSCCICYGGNSFPGPIREALECFTNIIHTRVGNILNPLGD